MHFSIECWVLGMESTSTVQIHAELRGSDGF